MKFIKSLLMSMLILGLSLPGICFGQGITKHYATPPDGEMSIQSVQYLPRFWNYWDTYRRNNFKTLAWGPGESPESRYPWINWIWNTGLQSIYPERWRMIWDFQDEAPWPNHPYPNTNHVRFRTLWEVKADGLYDLFDKAYWSLYGDHPAVTLKDQICNPTECDAYGNCANTRGFNFIYASGDIGTTWNETRWFSAWNSTSWTDFTSKQTDFSVTPITSVIDDLWYGYVLLDFFDGTYKRWPNAGNAWFLQMRTQDIGCPSCPPFPQVYWMMEGIGLIAFQNYDRYPGLPYDSASLGISIGAFQSYYAAP